jgi:plasmid stabilization system protein ParE
MTLSVAWDPRAEQDLRDIRSWQDAAWIVREVNRYATHGIGDLRIVVTPQGRRARVLFLPAFRVFMCLDRANSCLWIVEVLRSSLV